MRVIVVGLGIQGYKRSKVAGKDLIYTVDPFNNEADFKSIYDVPLNSYDSALLCIPDEPKFELIHYLLKNKKNVLVEKPVLFNSDVKFKQLDDLAKKNNVCYYTAYNHRFEPHFEEVKKIIESGKLGNIYSIKMFYGNGTARLVKNSKWRDKGYGVLPDLGSHLLDTINFWLGSNFKKFKVTYSHKFENKSYDNITFQSVNSKIQLICEVSLLSWRNNFDLDIYAENGTLHVNSLCKWGPSSLTYRERILPSGRPKESSKVLIQDDPTWVKEYKFFKSKSGKYFSNIDNDKYVNKILKNLYKEL